MQPAPRFPAQPPLATLVCHFCNRAGEAKFPERNLFSSFSWFCCGARRALLWAMLWFKCALVSHSLTNGFLEHAFLLAEEQYRRPKQDTEAHERAHKIFAPFFIFSRSLILETLRTPLNKTFYSFLIQMWPNMRIVF